MRAAIGRHNNALLLTSADDPAKVQQYLLSPSHPIGRAKARFFRRLGFAAPRWEELRDALLRHAGTGDATSAAASPFGQ